MILRPPGRPGSVFLPWAVIAIVAGMAGQAAATPLEEDACRKLQTERKMLDVQGVDKNVERGADWAKTNLKPADILLVKRYLEVYEQLKFRCEKVIALVEPLEPDDEKDDEEPAREAPAPAPSAKDAASIEQVSPAKENGAQPVTVTHGLTVSARETKGDLEIKQPPAKEAKPAAKDVKSAAKDAKPAAKDAKTAKDAKPKPPAKAAAAKSTERPAEEQ